MTATRTACAACGQTIRRSTGLALCTFCAVLAADAFEASVEGAHPDVRQRAGYAFWGGRNAPAIEAAKAARGAVGAVS